MIQLSVFMPDDMAKDRITEIFTRKMAIIEYFKLYLGMRTFFMAFLFVRDVDDLTTDFSCSKMYAEVRRDLLLSLQLFCKGDESAAEQKFCVGVKKIKREIAAEQKFCVGVKKIKREIADAQALCVEVKKMKRVRF